MRATYKFEAKDNNSSVRISLRASRLILINQFQWTNKNQEKVQYGLDPKKVDSTCPPKAKSSDKSCKAHLDSGPTFKFYPIQVWSY